MADSNDAGRDRPDDRSAGDRLRRLLRNRRAELRMTTIALARQASLGRTTVSKALNGPELMSSETLDALAKAMRMTVEPLHELYDRAEEEQSDPPRPQLREFFDNLIGQHTHLFAGRQVETALITAHIRDRGSGYVFVEAKSGFGKTSLLADLVHRNPEFHYHFISQAYRGGSGFDPTSLDHVLNCLCEQLDPAHVPGLDPTSLQQHFRGLLARQPRKQTVVVLDAIDELAKTSELGPLLPHRLPPGMTVVLSARWLDGRSYLDDIGFRADHLGLRVSLPGLDLAALVELLGMARGKAPALAADEDFVAEMYRVSAGDPFYIRFLVDDAATGRLTRQTVMRMPTGLEGYLDQQLEQLYRSAHRAEHLRILSYLLKAGTLSGSDLVRGVPGLAWYNFDPIIREIHRFLLVQYLDGPLAGLNRRSYSFCHDRFRQYFLSRLQDGEA
ncbi:helix-turn-helix domain-containing protein [Streptomyces yangpuensis]|uniref:helix-turn-helix domain-containing protein n=1 Tax=Streptomyces yangpuensis TaxID=1648182 RepID=UPI003699A0B0